jgi:TolB-like protein
MLGVSVAEDTLKTAPRLSIVVLPFENLSGDPEQEFFADGITDDLTTDLSHLPDSFVIARGTAFTYKGKQGDAKQIGRELGVRYVLEGSVQRVGETITVNAQLISTDTGAQVWADRFEGERSKLGQLQVEVVARLANSLNVELVKVEALRAARERPSNPDAVDLAMQGWAAYYKGWDAANVNEALGYFERALRLDPDLMRARVGLALMLVSGGQEPSHDTVRTWARGFWKAMALAPATWSKLAEDERTQVIIAPFIGFFDLSSLHSNEPPADIDDLLDAEAALIPPMILVLRKLARIREAAGRPASLRRGGKLGRNDPCPCGSGRKYKRCCASAWP